MKVIALTGGIASGKTTACRLFEAHGVPVIDTDLLARKAVLKGSPDLSEIEERYGPSILDEHGNLKRSKLGEIIFSDADEKSWLEQLLHPRISTLAKKQYQLLQQTRSSAYCIYAIPLYVETLQRAQEQPFRYFRVCLIDLPQEQQAQRLAARNKCSFDEAHEILANQVDRHERFGYVQDVLDNRGQEDALADQVHYLHMCYSRLIDRIISQKR